jgi:Ribbon-helix-helix protein, copG family
MKLGRHETGRAIGLLNCLRTWRYGMTQKTTVYLPDEMKLALEREALRRGCSEAQVIRDAVAKAVSRPRPVAGIFDGESLSERVDELLVGLGDR